MEKPSNPKWDNVKATLWFIAMIEVLILFLAIVSGHVCGYKNSLIGFSVLGLLIGGALFLVLITVIAIDLVIRFVGKRLSGRS